MNFGEWLYIKYSDNYFEVIETATAKRWTFTKEIEAVTFYENRRDGKCGGWY